MPETNINCPYCLNKNATIDIQPKTGTYHCSFCKSQLPRNYVEAKQVIRSTVGIVGFSGHGKTVYLTSLFLSLSKFSKYWSQYYFRSLDEYTHRIVYEQVPMFESGRFPESTPANFPNPALIHYNDIPVFDDAYLGFYDTAGEVFRDSDQIARAGFFVAQADVLLFIISIADIPEGKYDEEMSKLLDTYIRAVEDKLSMTIKGNQKIIVIFSKADIIVSKMPEKLKNWFENGIEDWYAFDLSNKLVDMDLMSMEIEEWLLEKLEAHRFVNMVRANFHDYRFAFVSSTGFNFDPSDKQPPQPLRVLDPWLWALKFSQQTSKQISQKSAKNSEKKGILGKIKSWFGK